MLPVWISNIFHDPPLYKNLFWSYRDWQARDDSQTYTSKKITISPCSTLRPANCHASGSGRKHFLQNVQIPIPQRLPSSKQFFFTRVSNANLFVQQLIMVHTDRPNVVGQSRSARTNRIFRKWKAGIFLTAECSGGRVFFAGRSGWHVYLPSKNTGIVDFPAISRGCATSAKVSPTRENKWRADRERDRYIRKEQETILFRS